MDTGGDAALPGLVDAGAREPNDDIPQGKIVSLNSKRLVLDQLRVIASMLGVTTKATAAQTRQVIEGKLIQQGYEPRNVQVVISTDNRLFLVNEAGTIAASPETHGERSGHVQRDYSYVVTNTHVTNVSNDSESVETLRSALREARLENEQLQSCLEARRSELEGVCDERDKLISENSRLEAALSLVSLEEVERLRAEVQVQSAKAKRFWTMRCEQMLEHDELMEAKELELTSLRAQLAALRTHGGNATVSATSTPAVHNVAHQSLTLTPITSGRQQADCSSMTAPSCQPSSGSQDSTVSIPASRKGKAPPVDLFTGESDVMWEDWLPTFELAAAWNAWTEEEKLWQLAGHLRGKAAQEWALIVHTDKLQYVSATRALGGKLDRGHKALAAQEFRHTVQRFSESVPDFILRLEQTYRRAYGKENMSLETRDTLLYGQLQEGLKYTLVESPAVSGARSYNELCLAARNEERRLTELHRRQQYQSKSLKLSVGVKRNDNADKGNTDKEKVSSGKAISGQFPARSGTAGDRLRGVKCWNCGKGGHMASDCRAPRRESSGRDNGTRDSNKMVTSAGTGDQDYGDSSYAEKDDPLQYLLSDSSDSEENLPSVNHIRLLDAGSKPQHVDVVLGGVPMEGVIDSGSDITIIGSEMFKKVATVAKLHKKDFKPPDKQPRTYNLQPFHVDGRIDVDVSFHDRTMRTSVYVKMDAPEQLLLSEGVCRQLGIVRYHSDVRPGNVKVKAGSDEDVCTVPVVRVRLVDAVRLLPNQQVLVEVKLQWEGAAGLGDSLLFEPNVSLQGEKIQALETVLPCCRGKTYVPIVNRLGFTQKMTSGADIGTVQPVEVVEPGEMKAETAPVRGVTAGEETVTVVLTPSQRKSKLAEVFSRECPLQDHDMEQLLHLLTEFHDIFSIEDGERGETDWVKMSIDTGKATPVRQQPRRVPFAARSEIARQLKLMQDNGVIQPSNSPWASPIVLVRKKDGTMRFCIDYRKLNMVTKADKYPLPRIDDLLDQLGKAQYFSTLDLAAGYWQIRVDEDSQEKTAFTTQQGLYEFRVMPFGLTNAPAVFQRLMQTVIGGLNPPDGPDFVCVYIDDLLVFSNSLEDHLQHLHMVMDRLRQAKLKLKPAKCHFVRQSVEFLGHVITPLGLQPNPRQTAAVQEFPVPQSLHQLRQFLGLTSYYRRFIKQYAKMAAPLYRLTKKDSKWVWDEWCQQAFESLKQKLVQSPVLMYPDFEKKFVLETDASLSGLGAVLSQTKDSFLHAVSFASRSLSSPEKNYSITELETLAVVWAVQHYRAYLYGHEVEIITDHSAVKSILEAPSLSGKHARWWLKVFGSGIKNIEIKYRPGSANVKADSLSRNPVSHPEGEDLEVQVSQIGSDPETLISDLLGMSPATIMTSTSGFSAEQQKDSTLKEIYDYIQQSSLPDDKRMAKKISAQAVNFAVLDGILYLIDSKQQGRKRAAVPHHLQKQILMEYHGGIMAGHFSGDRLYKLVSRHWWWEKLYRDAIEYCRNCPECAVVSGMGRVNKPPLHPIPVCRPFQVWGVDVMELPTTARHNRYVIVFQDLFTKWPLVFAVPDQKAVRIAKLLAEELIPMFGCPESLLSDRGTNLLATVMQDVCKLMGITKLNTTAYHPQCDGLVERMNRTLKAMLRKHSAKFGKQWDTYLPGVLWAYRNMPHESTKEKPSFLLFGMDCRAPTEAALLPPEPLAMTDVGDYREQLILSLSSARELAVTNIQAAQRRYKKYHDRTANQREYKLGDWVLVRFPHEESGRLRKLSQPWHGPYRITRRNDPDLTLVKVYFPDEGTIQVHQTRACPCPPQLPAGFYWYGGNRKSPGKIPQWLRRILDSLPTESTTRETTDQGTSDDKDDSHTEHSGLDNLFDESSEYTDTAGVELEDQGQQPLMDDITSAEHRHSLRDRSRINPPRRYTNQIRDESHS